MIIFRRIIPFVGTAVLLVLYSGLTYRPLEWREWTAAIILSTIFSVVFMLRWKWRSVDTLSTLFPILMLVVGATGTYFFLNTTVTQVTLAVIVAILYGIYMETVFTLHFQPSKYTSLSLPRLSAMLHTVSIVLVVNALFAIDQVAPYHHGILTLVTLGVVTGMTVHLFHSFSILKREYAIKIFAIVLVLTELVWVLQYLPTAFFVNGAVVGIGWYMLSSIIRFHLRDALSRRVVLQYCILGAVIFALIAATAQWV